ncbi:MAG: hypothetical protein L0228_07360 [Planctomycetes bacterium]|nr:hypothetical protein [Planctomycetota bacterium]
MAELTAILLVIGVVLAVVTVVGHGIWVLLSVIFRSSTRSGSSDGDAAATSAALAKDRQSALRVLRRQLDELVWRGALDDETRARLMAVIGEEERRVVGKAVRVATIEIEAVEAVELTPVVPVAAAADTSASHVDTGPVAAVPLGERARKFAASREAAAKESLAEAAAANVEPVKPAEPSVPVSRLFAAFMEENNIRWGELVGGLLIVGCSVALVISLWSQIAGRPLLQFVLFNGVTAALFGVGMYTERRWKIHTTSRGVLAIATLLVPLNFLALAASTQSSPPADLLPLAGEVASLIVFALLVYTAGRILVPGDAVLLVVGVMVPCLVQLLVRRFAAPGMSLASLYSLAFVPVAAYLASSSIAMWKRWNASLVEAEANRVLLFVGLVSAAAVMPLALLLYFAPPLRTTLRWLSPLVSMCGLPALLVGLLFWRRMTDRAFSGLQTAGIGVGALGAILMLASIVLAWPDPATLLPTALVTGVVMLAVAVWFGIPAVHVPAGLAFAAAGLVGYYALRGDVGWTLDEAAPLKGALLSAATGYVLMPLAAAFAAVAWWLRRVGRGEDSFMYGLVTAATAAASLALALWFGFGRAGDPQNITWLLAIYALGALAAGVVLGRVDAARAGSALLLAAFVQAIVFRYGTTWNVQQPWVAALLAHALLMALGSGVFALIAAGAIREPSALAAARRGDVLRLFAWSALVTSVAAAVWLIATIHTMSAGAVAFHSLWLAGVWLLLAVLNASPALFSASQVATVFAILCGATAAVENRGWYTAAVHPWLDPWFLEVQGIALAAYCLLLSAVRWFVARAALGDREQVVESSTPMWTVAAKKLLEPSWPWVDHVAQVAVVCLVALLATYAAAPGVAQELSPTAVAGDRVVPPVETFELASSPHLHAAGRGAWAALAVVAAALAVGLWQRDTRWRIIGLAIVAMAGCLLLAARWESQDAVASALRWISAGFFAIASVVIWIVQHKGATGSASVRENEALAEPVAPVLTAVPIAQQIRDLLVAFVVLVYVAMGAYVAQATLLRADISADVQEIWPWALVWALLAGVVAIVLPHATSGQNRDGDTRSWTLHVRDVLLLLAIAPAVILMTFAVARVLDQRPIVGPEPGSWFRQIGWDVSYGVPLAVIALAFVGHAVCYKSSRFAFAAGLLFNVVATMVVLLRLARGGGVLDASAWVMVAQVNAIVSGAVALVWQAAVAWRRSPVGESLRDSNLRLGETQPLWPLLLITQVALAAALCGTFLLPGAVNLLFDAPPAAWAAAADGALGWSAVALATAAATWLQWHRGVSQSGIALFAAAIVAIVALTAARTDTGNWQAYHTLLAGNCIAAWALPVVARIAHNSIAGKHDSALSPPLIWSSAAARSFGVAGVFLALWGYDGDPGSPWWTIAALVVISARNVWIAWQEGSRGSMWIAAVLFVPAISILWLDWANQFSATTKIGLLGEPIEFLWVNVLAVALMALISVWVERRANTIKRGEMSRQRAISFHRFAAWAIVATLLLTTAIGLVADLLNASFVVSVPLAWAAWIAAAVVAVACLWDPAVRWSVACLYCIGLIAVGLYLDALNLRPPLFHWALANALAAYSLATSGLWSVRDRLRATLAPWGVPMAAAAKPQAMGGGGWSVGSGHGWLVPANILLGGFVLLLVTLIELTVGSFMQRMVAAYAIGAQAFAIGLLARGGVRTSLQYLALVWGVMFVIAFGWAWLQPDFVEPWLHRLVVTVAALAVMVVVYGFGLVKFLQRENEWTRAAARLVPSLALVTVVLILVVLAVETAAYVERGEVQIAMPALVAIGLALAGLVAAALAAALLPGRDPLGLSERGRTVYVYAAEGLAALLFLHIRVTLPWLFSGWFQQFWPLIVMVIAFVGIGVGELFQRRQQRVLSEPLQTTGALLPLLPVIGFWVVSSEVDYSLLLLSIGVLYASLSVLRKSFLYAALAAISANGSLWYLLHDRQGLSFFEHPQLWLIPPALSALIAAYINRERLSTQQSAAIRYASAIVIYVSSTADVFINGVANAPWLPAVLAGLSILGVLAGILLRVRAFLYLGTAFLVVALMTIIWHAAIHQQRTYILWVAGIVTGALIIALFGLFEKRRDDVLRVVEELKHWHA